MHTQSSTYLMQSNTLERHTTSCVCLYVSFEMAGFSFSSYGDLLWPLSLGHCDLLWPPFAQALCVGLVCVISSNTTKETMLSLNSFLGLLISWRHQMPKVPKLSQAVAHSNCWFWCSVESKQDCLLQLFMSVNCFHRILEGWYLTWSSGSAFWHGI